MKNFNSIPGWQVWSIWAYKLRQLAATLSSSKQVGIQTCWKTLCGELISEARNTNVQTQLSIALQTTREKPLAEDVKWPVVHKQLPGSFASGYDTNSCHRLGHFLKRGAPSETQVEILCVQLWCETQSNVPGCGKQSVALQYVSTFLQKPIFPNYCALSLRHRPFSVMP